MNAKNRLKEIIMGHRDVLCYLLVFLYTEFFPLCDRQVIANALGQLSINFTFRVFQFFGGLEKSNIPRACGRCKDLCERACMAISKFRWFWRAMRIFITSGGSRGVSRGGGRRASPSYFGWKAKSIVEGEKRRQGKQNKKTVPPP